MKYFAQIMSLMFHPLLLPLYGLFFIFNSDSVFSLIPMPVKLYCYAITIFFVLVMPLLSLPVFKKLKLINSYYLETSQERVYPALGAIFFAFIGFYIIRTFPYTNVVQQLYLVLIIVLAGFSIVTIRWKMSMHMTAMGAVCGFLFILGFKYLGDIQITLPVMFLISGILASSRLYLEKHNPAQVYAGYLFGLVFVIFILF